MKWLPYILLTLINVCLLICHCRHSEALPPMRDTIIDTVRFINPVAVDSVVTRYKVVTVARVRDSVAINEVDSFVYDTIQVRLPIVSKYYSSNNYEAWVSGFEPSLDSINVFTKVISRHPSRWSVGLQGGVGITPRGVQPYVGVGVAYKLW